MSVLSDETCVAPQVEAQSTTTSGSAPTGSAPGCVAAKPRAPADGSGGGLLTELLSEAQDCGASDLLLVAGTPPTVFVSGRWTALQETAMAEAQIAACIEPILTEEQRDKLRLARDLDLGFSVPGKGRFRANIHYQRGSIAAAIRAIPEEIPAFQTLGLPAKVLDIADMPAGLVLVTGGTGQGKSTTLAAVIDHMNQSRASHIITIEDPMEFNFRQGKCLIEQREIGDDSPSFASALRHVLRQRPDVILIGEMRDTETMSAALTAAETGHLVLATLHTASASQTLARVIDVFPPTQQSQVRTPLSASLRAILCQTLVSDQLNGGLVPATELLLATNAIRRAIRENEAHLIHSMIETGRRYGMHTMEQSLEALVQAGRVSADDAVAVAADPVRMRKMVGHGGGVASE